MKQSKLMSWVETCLNTGIGFAVAITAQILVFPLFGFNPPLSTNLYIGLIFMVVSIVRSYILRRLFEALHIRRPLSPFVTAVVAERFRQIEAEGFDVAHDDNYPRGVLATAGAVYALYGRIGALDFWPWDHEWFKPQDHRRNMVRSAALIIAEGEKFDRERKRR